MLKGSEWNFNLLTEIKTKIPTEEAFDGNYEDSLLNQFKNRNSNDDDIDSDNESKIDEINNASSDFTLHTKYFSTH